MAITATPVTRTEYPQGKSYAEILFNTRTLTKEANKEFALLKNICDILLQQKFFDLSQVLLFGQNAALICKNVRVLAATGADVLIYCKIGKTANECFRAWIHPRATRGLSGGADAFRKTCDLFADTATALKIFRVAVLKFGPLKPLALFGDVCTLGKDLFDLKEGVIVYLNPRQFPMDRAQDLSSAMLKIVKSTTHVALVSFSIVGIALSFTVLSTMGTLTLSSVYCILVIVDAVYDEKIKDIENTRRPKALENPGDIHYLQRQSARERRPEAGEPLLVVEAWL